MTTLTYVDSSVLVRSYLADEPEHAAARRLVESRSVLMTSTLALLEVSSTLVRAARSRRIGDVDTLLAKLYEEVSPTGPIALVRADTLDTENTARVLVRRFGIRALDSLHLAVAHLAARPLAGPGEDLGFASYDPDQRAAAADLGFVDRAPLP
ncbi:type II toxin-antitoxin system VapC family toxin [Jiangella gansuensis]|uniref:type II toxin-antitoxin system VapC family toxin n=1 Tax=Jiangella gansuensis TaxID=281473 RepID=UPI00047B27CD|nr:type II toxin-antitoxin system VapC family toxin [Jiangella gansuensis]